MAEKISENVANNVTNNAADIVMKNTSRTGDAHVLLRGARRLRMHSHISLTVLLLAIVVFRIPEVPEWIAYVDQFGFTKQVLGRILFSLSQGFISAVIFMAAFVLSSKTASEMVARPGLFILVLLVGATVAVVAGLEIGVALDHEQHFWGVELGARSRALDLWIKHMLGGALFGWMYFLYRQRTEDEASFVSMLARRSLLARHVAQSRLVATRARIDPEMVARVLHRVHDTYRVDARDASALLDHMISYLRPAMNRARDTAPGLTAELTLCRSYLALHAAETGVPMTLNADADRYIRDGKSVQGVPVFQTIRYLLRHALLSKPTAIVVRIETHSEHIAVSIATGIATLSVDSLAAISTDLEELFFQRPVVLLHSFEADGNRYRVQLPT
jgi:hypothetical protein